MNLIFRELKLLNWIPYCWVKCTWVNCGIVLNSSPPMILYIYKIKSLDLHLTLIYGRTENIRTPERDGTPGDV